MEFYEKARNEFCKKNIDSFFEFNRMMLKVRKSRKQLVEISILPNNNQIVIPDSYPKL